MRSSRFQTMCVVGMACLIGVAAIGDPLAPPLDPLPVAGEAELLSVFFSDVVVGYVDWMVLGPGMGGGEEAYDLLILEIMGVPVIPEDVYLYTYQVESLVADGTAFSVNVSPESVLDTGDLDGLDMDFDLFGHDVTTFANVAGEHEGFTYDDDATFTFDADIGDNNVTWEFDSTLASGFESDILWILATAPPQYSLTYYADSVPPSPGTGRVPAPLPDGGITVLLLGLGLAAVGVVASRFRRE